MPSYQAEESLTRRHLAEFTHFEAEMPFYTFEKLLNFVEDLIVNVIGNVVESCKEQLTILDSAILKTGPPKKPFIRIKHSDAIKKLQASGTINNKTGEPFKVGEDIPEKNERQFVEDIGAPVLLTHFPAQLKAFYMQ
ncbi:MAG: putative asparaginyl-tRNA synthetase, partial [Streblomastix strix]